MIVDATLFYNEIDMLEVRLKYLDDFIDKFFIVESDHTFSGKYKGFMLEEYLVRVWPHMLSKIEIYKNSEYLTKENFESNSMSDDKIFMAQIRQLASSLIGDKNINTWLNDFYQRELIKKLNSHIDPEDLVFISDIDEIFDLRKADEIQADKVNFLDQDYLKFSVHFKQNIPWIKVYCCKWEKIMERGVNILRASFVSEDDEIVRIKNGGWHFTSFGKSEDFLNKLKAWSHQEYNTFLGRLISKFRFERGMDPFGSGEIMKYSVPEIDEKLLFLLTAKYSFRSISPTPFDRALHHAIYFCEKLYRKIFM